MIARLLPAVSQSQPLVDWANQSRLAAKQQHLRAEMATWRARSRQQLSFLTAKLISDRGFLVARQGLAAAVGTLKFKWTIPETQRLKATSKKQTDKKTTTCRLLLKVSTFSDHPSHTNTPYSVTLLTSVAQGRHLLVTELNVNAVSPAGFCSSEQLKDSVTRQKKKTLMEAECCYNSSRNRTRYWESSKTFGKKCRKQINGPIRKISVDNILAT